MRAGFPVTVYTAQRVERIRAMAGQSSAAEIADEIGVTVASLRSWGSVNSVSLATQKFRRFTVEEIATIKRMAAEGASGVAIARVLDRPAEAIRKKCVALGVSLRPVRIETKARVTISAEALAALKAEADSRGISVMALANRLLSAIAESDLFVAVLDGFRADQEQAAENCSASGSKCSRAGILCRCRCGGPCTTCAAEAAAVHHDSACTAFGRTFRRDNRAASTLRHNRNCRPDQQIATNGGRHKTGSMSAMTRKRSKRSCLTADANGAPVLPFCSGASFCFVGHLKVAS